MQVYAKNSHVIDLHTETQANAAVKNVYRFVRDQHTESTAIQVLRFLYQTRVVICLPAENTEDEVEDKEGSEDDQADKVDPWPGVAHRVIHPIHDGRPAFHGDTLEDRQHGQPEIVEIGDARVGSFPSLAAVADFRTH